MSFLLDTDICSAHLKGNRAVFSKFMQFNGSLHVSSVTVGELFTWALRRGVSPKRLDAVRDFLSDVAILDVTCDVGEKFGELRALRFDAGQSSPDMDMLIAATALVHDLTLVTHNIQDYQFVSGLRIQDWLSP